MTSVAPEDIGDTINWLTDKDWIPTSGKGGPQEAFGNVLVEFGKGGGVIQIVRDRGIWQLAFRFPGWQSSFDLGIIMDARAGRTTWVPSERNPYEVRQLPEEVRWAQALPEIINWLASTPDVGVLLDACRQRRFSMMYPRLKPKG